jgi:hypothetical protein
MNAFVTFMRVVALVCFTLWGLQHANSEHDCSLLIGSIELIRLWSGQHLLSSVAYPDGYFYTFTNPVGAVRLGSTAQTAMGAGNTLTMRVMQGEIA